MRKRTKRKKKTKPEIYKEMRENELGIKDKRIKEDQRRGKLKRKEKEKMNSTELQN